MTSIKKTAVLLDLGFVLQKLYERLGKRHATALEVRNFSQKCLAADEELFRVYCYHCPPYDQTEIHPLTGAQVDVSASKTYTGMQNLIRNLGSAPLAVLLGRESDRGSSGPETYNP